MRDKDVRRFVELVNDQLSGLSRTDARGANSQEEEPIDLQLMTQ